jgi:hypothetical protein
MCEGVGSAGADLATGSWIATAITPTRASDHSLAANLIAAV